MAIDEINNDALTATEETVPNGTVTVNFNTMKASSMELGHIGEHNATTLEVTWTNEDQRAASYRVAFQTGGKSILSDSYNSMPIEIALWQQLTLNPRCSIQVIAYDENGDYIGKSAKFGGFYFAPSVTDREATLDADNHDLAAEVSRIEAELSGVETDVAANTAARHTHSNKAVLDKLGESGGTPTYDGQPIGGGGGTITDVQDEQGNSLVDDGVATIPDDTVQLWDSVQSKLAYTVEEILAMRGKKAMYYRTSLVVAVAETSTTPSLMQIYYVIKNNYSPYNYMLRYDEYSSDGTRVSYSNNAGRWSDYNFGYDEYTKLNGIATGAQVNVIEKIKDSSGTELTITNKAVTLPTIPSIPNGTADDDIIVWDDTNSEWDIRAKGSISSGNTGWVTGGEIYTVVGDIESALAALIGGNS